MWDKQKFDNFFDYYPQMYNKTIQDSYLIKNIQYDEGTLVSLNSVTTGKGFGFNGTPEELSVVNDVLKDNYKVISPNMNESEDEFNVDAPIEWNVELLTVGDYITPDMWQDGVEETFDARNHGKLFKKLITKPVKIDHVLEGDNIYFTVEGVDPVFTNDVLLPQYQVVKDKNIFESEDEFNVNAPTKWNVTELTVGDEIEPYMWDLNNIDLYDFIDDPNENWIIDKIDDRDIQIVTETGGETWCRVDDINGILKPEYKIVEFLSESEDEFSVEAPKQWNVETLTVGDTITPDMWNKQKFINDGWFGEEGWFGLEAYNKTIQDSYLIQSMFFDEGDEDFEADWQVNLNSTTTGKSFNIIGDSTPLKILNSLLKDNYKVYSPKINESEDDFSVDAPSKWNVTELGVGDYIAPEMIDVPKNKRQWDNFHHIFADPKRGPGWKINKFFFTSERGVYVRLEYRGNWSDFRVDFVNEYLKPQYRITPPTNETKLSNLLEMDDDWTVDNPSEEWNIEYLTVGDTITPDMWGKKWNDKFQKENRTIEEVEYDEDDNSWGVSFGRWYVFYLDRINDLLKPQYKISPSSFNITESEDEFNVVAPNEWNVETLTVGDTITPDMWNVSKLVIPLKYYFKKPVEISWMGYSEFDDEEEELLVNINLGSKYMDFDINHVNDLLKPEYKIVSPGLNESEDEFSVDAPSEWNAPDLKIGSIITPDMWDDEVKELSSINQFKIALTTPLTIKTIYPQNIGGSPGLLMGFTNGTYIHSSFLKPQYQIISNLSENKDEFTVDAPENWNVETLTVGDTITADMFKTIEDTRHWMDKVKKLEILKFSNFGDYSIVNLSLPNQNETYVSWVVDNVNEDLKSNYQIALPLHESEDEDWTVDAPESWNVTELGIGSILDPSNLKMQDHSKKYEIVDFGVTLFPWEDKTVKVKVFELVEEPIPGTRRTTRQWKHTRNSSIDLDTLKRRLKDNYKIISTLNESDDDEFTVKAPKGWDVTYLRVGDTITPKMWNKREIKQVTSDISFDEPLKIKWIGTDGFDGFIEFEGYDSDYLNVEFIHDILKPKYRISLSNINESDDEFNVDAPEDWNVQYLGVGDTIQGKMWNWENIITWCNRVAGDNNVELNELIRRWEDVYDEGATIDRIVKYGDYHHVEFDSDSGFLRFGPNVSTVNNWLSDGYEIEKLLTEEAEDFNVIASPKWDIIELGVGDYINSNMLNPKGNDYIWFSRRKLFIENIYFDECWTVNLLHVESNYHTQFCIDYINEDVLNDKYKIMTSLKELSKLLEVDDEFNVEAPKEWDVQELGIGDKITRDMIKNPDFLDQMDEDFRMDFPGVITNMYRAGVPGDEYWGVRIKFQDVGWRKYLPKSKDIKLGLGFTLDGFNQNTLKPQYQIQKPVFELSSLLENEEDFNVNAPDEWNVELLTVGDTITPDMWGYDGIFFDVSKPLTIEDIGEDEGGWWIQLGRSEAPFDLDEINEYLKSKYRVVPYILEESDDEFSVDAPEEWWEYDGDVEIMFQDTYWYEDENGKEAIVERDGGGILNINDLEQYSYSGWKPFTGNPTNEKLKNWWYSINWDTDLIEIFSFDDSIFEVEEDFEWSSAENIDMDRTGFEIRAVSTLKEVEDEFTVRPSKKWDIVYLNKGDFLDNTNSTFNDPNVKYEIGNITSGGEIEVKKYINRGGNFEPQFDRFMKTRKGIVKAKLKPGFDIETSSK